MPHDFPSDMEQGNLLNLICDIGINKHQRHGTFVFLKIYKRHGEPLSRAQHVLACSCNIKMLAHTDYSKAGDQSALWNVAHVRTLPSLAR